MMEYSFLHTTCETPPFDCVTDYLLKVPCTNRPDVLDYVYRLYCYDKLMYITDIFPKMFADDPRCFKRFTSREGYAVDMRKLSLSCLQIFVDEFIANDLSAVMVVSGSYEPGEDEQGPSRKLKLYWYFFKSHLDELHLRVIDLWHLNAFLLTSVDNPHEDSELSSIYSTFKSVRHGSSTN